MERELNEYFREITQGCYSKIEGRLQKYGIVKAQAQLLLLIKENDGCTQKDLASFVGVKYSSMSERLDKLEKNGYIERAVDEDNLKYKRVYITKEGKLAAVQCKRILREIEDVLFKGFTKKDRSQFEEYLNRMITNLNR
ncbi:MAG: MarR family transcriptional regulator [Clostridia bacterium]|nr:MarR family transcriptional regulator [Clostridia bacterium]